MQHRILNNRAFTLVELAIVVLVLGVVVAGVVQMTNRYSAQRYDTQTAQEVKNMTSAVEAFIKNNASEITKLNPADGTVCGFLSVTDPTTAATHAPVQILFNGSTPSTTAVSCDSGASTVVAAIKAYLPANFTPANPYLIGFKRAANISTADATISATNPGVPNISAMVMRQASSGDNLTDTRLARIASNIGNEGGFIASNGTNATGAFGGWNAVPADYGLTTSASSIAALTTFSATNSVLNTNMLSRVKTGNSEANTMRTNLNMGNDTTTASADINAITGVRQIDAPHSADSAGNLTVPSTIAVGGKLGGDKQTGLKRESSNVLALDNNTFLQAPGGISLGEMTTAVAGQPCVYNVPATANDVTNPIDVKAINGIGFDIRKQIGVFGPVKSWYFMDDFTPNSDANLVKGAGVLKTTLNLPSGTTTYGAVLPILDSVNDISFGEFSGKAFNPYDKPAIVNEDYALKALVPIGSRQSPNQSTGKPIITTYGYHGRILLGRSSYFDNKPALLICQVSQRFPMDRGNPADYAVNGFWRPLNQLGHLGPDNPAVAAVSVGPSTNQRIKTTYAPFEQYNSGYNGVNPYLGGSDHRSSKQLFATLGLNTICGWTVQNPINTVQNSGAIGAGATYQFACGTPESVLGKRACFWSNGTGGAGTAYDGSGNATTTHQRYSITPFNRGAAGGVYAGNDPTATTPKQIVPSLAFLVPATTPFAGDPLQDNASFSEMTAWVDPSFNQQICPAGYYVSGTAVNGSANAPYLDMSVGYQGIKPDSSCGQDAHDCTYIYCCPFDPDPSLNLYDLDQPYGQTADRTELYLSTTPVPRYDPRW